jgi:hypothetical protein
MYSPIVVSPNNGVVMRVHGDVFVMSVVDGATLKLGTVSMTADPIVYIVSWAVVGDVEVCTLDNSCMGVAVSDGTGVGLVDVTLIGLCDTCEVLTVWVELCLASVVNTAAVVVGEGTDEILEDGVLVVVPEDGVAVSVPTDGVSIVVTEDGFLVVVLEDDASIVVPEDDASADIPEDGVSVVFPKGSVLVIVPEDSVPVVVPEDSVLVIVPEDDGSVFVVNIVVGDAG